MKREPAGLSTGPRHRWEAHGPILVASLLAPVNEHIRVGVCKSIHHLVTEFVLPVQVQPGPPGKEDQALAQQMVASCTAGTLLDGDRCVGRVRDIRAGGKLLHGLVVLLDPGKYERISYPGDEKEKAYYGYSVPDGLSLLLNYEATAVRHEVSHMLGLTEHCPDATCVMHYKCPRPGQFCTRCKMTLIDLWH